MDHTEYISWLKSLKVGDSVAYAIDYGDHFEKSYGYRKQYSVDKVRLIENDDVYIIREYRPFTNGIIADKHKHDYEMDHILKIIPVSLEIQEWIEKEGLTHYLNSSEFKYNVIPSLSLGQLRGIKAIIEGINNA